MDFLHYYESPLGRITLAADGDALTGLWFDGQQHFGETLSADRQESFLPVFSEADRWLDRYFSREMPDFTPALNPQGTPFRRLVWQQLLRIPYGRAITYGQLADSLSVQTGRRVSARAVGGAVGHNPISLIIPCHRVIGADGSLTGYAGGTGRKAALLRMESGITNTFQENSNNADTQNPGP